MPKKNLNIMSDDDLILRVKQLDRSAFEEIYNRYWGQLYLHALKMLRNEDEAKDVVQELFTSLWIRSINLEIRSSLSSYLYTGIRNRILNIFEHDKIKRNYLSSLQSFYNEHPCATTEWIRAKELSSIIESEVNNLPSKMQEIFKMNRYANCSYKEIAEHLHISDKTVKKQINNALNILRSKLTVLISTIVLAIGLLTVK